MELCALTERSPPHIKHTFQHFFYFVFDILLIPNTFSGKVFAKISKENLIFVHKSPTEFLLT